MTTPGSDEVLDQFALAVDDAMMLWNSRWPDAAHAAARIAREKAEQVIAAVVAAERERIALLADEMVVFYRPACTHSVCPVHGAHHDYSRAFGDFIRGKEDDDDDARRG